MRSGTTRYPVDRYLDKSSKKFEMVNIIDDDIWNPEPALRPEDEMILRKLHEMLQSTADDLKLLSGELAKYHEPGVVFKTPPTPLDEEFNEKVHIEEVVNAKFHGHKIINKPHNIPIIPLTHEINSKVDDRKYQKAKPLNTDLEKQNPSINKMPAVKKLGFSRTRIMQINDKKEDNSKPEKLNNGKVFNNGPAVGYNEYSFTYVEPKVKDSLRRVLQVQDMPSINIRSELKQQNVLQLDIFPDSKEKIDDIALRSNVAVISARHETESKPAIPKIKEVFSPTPLSQQKHIKESTNQNQTIRKVSKMSTCDSSGSTNNVSSDTKAKLVTQKRIISTIINSPKNSARSRTKKLAQNKNEIEKRQRANLEEWNRKLNIVYGSSTMKGSKTKKIKSNLKITTPLNNAEYIPYSKLTVGGVKAIDIEKEISDLPNKKDVPLSPILDKILNSRENSFHQETPRKVKESPRILTTSDENLLQEVINIERSVSDTLSKNINKVTNEPIKIPTFNKEDSDDNNSEDRESYADDFEDDKSEHSGKAIYKSRSEGNVLENRNKATSEASSESDSSSESAPNTQQDKNVTYTKISNLSFKDSVDVFEFVHSVDTQDTATQSNVTDKIYPKGTQTSPRTSQTPINIQPIHNDLWPSIDPRQEVEKMFELEKDLIKKLIIEEYGDLLEKNINKPSTSDENKHDDGKKNVTALQKNTQTSPARVKSVMTSPQRTKTRTTSPMTLSVPVDKNTSPMIVVTNDESHVTNAKSDADDISVNLSSPRFSLRLPQTTREVLSNITAKSQSPSKISGKFDKLKKSFRKTTISSSSSIDADNSSSELSSLGEIKIKRKLRRRISLDLQSECSSTSTLSKYSYDLQSILPLKSEGEVSWKQVTTKTGKSRRSEGETSFGPK